MSDFEGAAKGTSRRRVLIAAITGLAFAVAAPLVAAPGAAAAVGAGNPLGEPAVPILRLVEMGPGVYYFERVG